MNIFQAERKPFYQTVLDNVLFFTGAYRPLGALVYRVLYAIFGLNALPLRLLCYGLMLGNLLLLYRAAALIATREAAALAALIAAYNFGFVDLYLNSGTIYDLLCYCFYLSAFVIYVRARRHFAAVFLILYVCALNSKEIAVTLPVVLLLYELLLSKERASKRWAALAIAALITPLYTWSKLSSASVLAGNDAYRLHLGVRTYLRAFGRYLADLAYLPPGSIDITAAAAILALLLALALLSRQRTLLFLALFIVIAPMPVAFILYRGAYAFYVASFGLFLYIALLLTYIRRVMGRALAGPGELTPQANLVLQADTFVFAAIFLVLFHSSRILPTVSADQNRIQSVLAQMSSVTAAKLAPRSRILFLDDPFPVDSTDLVYLVLLCRRSPEMTVDRQKKLSTKLTPEAVKGYDALFSFQGDKPIQVFSVPN